MSNFAIEGNVVVFLQMSYVLKWSGAVKPSMPLPTLVRLNKAVFMIGREESKCDICLRSSIVPYMISRTHACIRKLTADEKKAAKRSSSGSMQTDWIIEDKNSMNGVFVNNVKGVFVCVCACACVLSACVCAVSYSPLQLGDLIVFGGKDATKMKIGQRLEQPGLWPVRCLLVFMRVVFVAVRL